MQAITIRSDKSAADYLTCENPLFAYETMVKYYLDKLDNIADMDYDFFVVDENIICFRSSITVKEKLKIIEESPIGEEFLYIGNVVQGNFFGNFENHKELEFKTNNTLYGLLNSNSGYMIIDKNTNVKTLGIAIRSGILKQIPELAKIFADKNFLRTTNSNLVSQVLIHNIFYSMGMKTSIDRFKTKANILQLVYLELNDIIDQTNKYNIYITDLEKLNHAKYILQNSLKPYTTKELSTMVGLNEFKLKRGFRHIFGTSVHQMSLAHRMENAKILLTNTNKPVGQISELVGFKHQQSFSHAFKRYYGFLPTKIKY